MNEQDLDTSNELISLQTFSEFLFPLRAGWPLPNQHVCVAYVVDEQVLLLLLLLMMMMMMIMMMMMMMMMMTMMMMTMMMMMMMILNPN